MNYDQAKGLLYRLSMFFPQFAPARSEEMKAAYVEKLLEFDYERARKAIETIIDGAKSRTGPSIAELRSTIFATKIISSHVGTVCNLCNGETWIVVDEHRNEVKPCACSPRELEQICAGPSGHTVGVVGWIESLHYHGEEGEYGPPPKKEEEPDIF